MHISRNSPAGKSAPNVLLGRALYESRLAALRSEAFGLRCQMDRPRNECRRDLLATRLDVVDARAAHVAALLIGVAA